MRFVPHQRALETSLTALMRSNPPSPTCGFSGPSGRGLQSGRVRRRNQWRRRLRRAALRREPVGAAAHSVVPRTLSSSVITAEEARNRSPRRSEGGSWRQLEEAQTAAARFYPQPATRWRPAPPHHAHLLLRRQRGCKHGISQISFRPQQIMMMMRMIL